MSETTKTINRDPSDKTAGFRLQKLRAIKVMLSHFLENPEALFWCSIEKKADVTLENNNKEGELERHLEEDKNYGEDNKITFNSSAILNTLVINIDSLHQFDFNPNTLFTFYTSTSYTKEGETKFTKENELSFPEEPVFSKLNTTVDGKKVESYGSAFDDDPLIELLSKVLLNEYKSQYSKKKYNGNFNSIEQWDLENWKDFFRRMRFFFGEPNHEEIYKDVETLVKSLPQYSDDLIGKEGLIISALLEEIENTQHLEGSSRGYVTNKSIELVYEQLKNGSRRPIDPSWMSWEKVEKPKDLRNIEEKIRDVLNDPNQKFMDRINRRAANGLTKIQEHNEDKTLKAVLYIIYDCCEEELNELVKNKESMTEQEITDSIEVLVEKSYEDIKEKASDYSYIVTNKKSIQELILYLVDSCYLAFD